MIANTQFLINTPPTTSRCHHCHRVTLCGLDYGMTYKVDPAPLTTLGELDARRAGRTIYRLIAGHFTYRALAHIPERDRYPIVASHTCEPINPTHLNPTHAATLLNLIHTPTTDPPLVLAIDPTTNTLVPAAIDDTPPY